MIGFDARAIVMRCVYGYSINKLRGVILSNQLQTKFLAIEFSSPQKDTRGGQGCSPLIEIRLGIGRELDQAKTFLRGQIYKIIECSNRAHKVVEDHIIEKCENREMEIDISDCLFYKGHLSPISATKGNAISSSIKRLLDENLDVVDGNFGVEFEVSCAAMIQPSSVVASIRNHAGVPVENKCPLTPDDDDYFWDHPFQSSWLPPPSNGDDFKDDKKSSSRRIKSSSVHKWRVVHDSSIQSNPGFALNTKFELVSPILQGQSGLNQCKHVLNAVNNTSAIQVNSSMGFHIHVDVEQFSLEQLIRVCQNFVHFEGVIDSLMHPSRRTGSDESKKYFDSNRDAVVLGEDNATNAQRRHDKIQACCHKFQLCNIMNPNGRYYKLNLQNLKTGRQPTIEFRQHSATSDFDTAASWVIFCLAFVHNSAHMREEIIVPKYNKDVGDDDDEDVNNNNGKDNENNDGFELMFDSLIQNSSLKDFYKKQRF